MLDTLIGIITLIGLQFFKAEANEELRSELEAEEYNRTLDEKETT